MKIASPPRALGTAVIDGVALPVRGIALRDGAVVFLCEEDGPVRAVDGGAVTVFGPDGLGICQGYCNVRWTAVARGRRLIAEVKLKMTRCFGDMEEPQ